MEAGGTKEQEKSQQNNGLEKKSEAPQLISEGVNEEVKAEAAQKEAKEDKEFTGKTRNEADGGSEAENAKVVVENEVLGESKAGKTEAAEIEAKVEEESTKKGLGPEEGPVSKTGQKEKTVKESSHSQLETKNISGTEDDISGKPEELQKGERGKANALEKNAKKEGRAGSTSDEPLSPEAEEEEEEFWPEFPPSSPEKSPQSPTEPKCLETGGIAPASTAPEAAAGGPASTEAAPKGDKEPHPPAEEAAAGKEKKKRPAFDRREVTRPRMPSRGQSRKAIVEKFGGAATGPAPNIKRTGGTNTVKTMLLEWCRAMTRGYEHVDIQNFSTSWKSGMAFCALIHKFFPDAFDYASLEPANRKENFTLAFSTAETYADCAQLLEVDDMVHMSVPDNKCIYTYIQELYRSLVEKGLVKTKKK